MKMINIAAAFILLMIGTGAHAFPVMQPSQSTPTRYPYCNVYLQGACFGISGGDSLNMEIPVDFTLYTINLWNGAKVTIYDGYNPSTKLMQGAGKDCSNANQAHLCRYFASAQAYEIVYSPTEQSQIIHLQATGITKKTRRGVIDFLSGFRKCRADHPSVQCTDERPFKSLSFDETAK